jgi:hypothetical protein
MLGGKGIEHFSCGAFASPMFLEPIDTLLSASLILRGDVLGSLSRCNGRMRLSMT